MDKKLKTPSSMSHYPIVLEWIAIVLLMSGCATGLSKEECQMADWHTIGYEDGVQGFPQSRISTHRKACAEHGVALRLKAYRGGWDAGIARYCQPGNGFHQGRTGKQYTGVCPQPLESAFLQAYRDGRSLYKLEADMRRTSNTITHKRNRLDQIELAMRDAGIEMVAEDTTTERRVVLLDEIRKLTDERSDIKAQIPLLEAERRKQQRKISKISSASAF
jgi:hypothetical protein